jgi:hypothetical protein
VDRLLARVVGLSAPQAAEQLGVSEGTVRRWRELREGDEPEPVPEPRGTPRDVLLRSMADGKGRVREPRAASSAKAEAAESAFLDRVHAILADQSIQPRDRVMLIDAAAGAWTRVVLYRGELNVGGRNAVLQAAEDGGNGRTELLRERQPTSPTAEVARVDDEETEQSKEATN